MISRIEHVPLNRVCEIGNGYAFKSEDFLTSGIPLLRISNIVNERVSFDGNTVYLDESKLSKHESFVVKKGDVLIALSGATTGKYGIYLSEEPCLLNQRIGIIRSDKSEKLNSKYFYFYLSILQSKIFSEAQGAAQPNISAKDIGSMEIPLPPLAEQQKIAAILDAADSLRQKGQQLVERYTALSQSLFLEMFGDPVTNPNNYILRSLSSVCDDLFLGLTSAVDYVDVEQGYPLIRAKDINTGKLVFGEVKYISEKQHKKLTKNHLTRKGDLLVSKSGTLGTCAIVDCDKEFSTYESIFTVRPNEIKINIYFLINIIRSEAFNKKILGNKVGGTVSHLNLKMFRDLDFPIPPINLQNQFAERIQFIEAQKHQAQRSLEKSEALFKSLLQRAFMGELTAKMAA